MPIGVFVCSAVLNGVDTQHHEVYSDQLFAAIQSYNIPFLQNLSIMDSFCPFLPQNRIIDNISAKNISQRLDFSKRLRIFAMSEMTNPVLSEWG